MIDNDLTNKSIDKHYTELETLLNPEYRRNKFR